MLLVQIQTSATSTINLEQKLGGVLLLSYVTASHILPSGGKDSKDNRVYELIVWSGICVNKSLLRVLTECNGSHDLLNGLLDHSKTQGHD